MSQNNSSSVDRLVANLTAFNGWADMLASLKTGYVPTITHSKNGEKLARVIEAHGFRVYMPRSKVASRR